MKHHWQILDEGNITVSATPEEMWKNATKYFKWCDENPIETKWTPRTGKMAGVEQIEKKIRPYSVKALCLHCGIEEEYLRDLRASKDKTSSYYKIASAILYVIYIQNFEMAAVDYYSPIFMTKVLGMDKDDTPPTSIKVIIENAVPELSTSESQILEKLELEMTAAKLEGGENPWRAI